MKTKFLFIAIFILTIFRVNAQTTDEVTLIVSADGTTKEEATKVALRSAIEQAYGTFVSSNTTILNDEVVMDEIVTISNGNIKEYKEIASFDLQNGSQSVTLQATVCLSKLVSYAQSKGATTEFAGATFGMNLKMYELNKQNEKVVWKNLLRQVKEMIPSCFKIDLRVDEPEVMDDKCELSFNITYTPTDNYFTLCKLVISTLESIAIKDKRTIPNGIETRDLHVSMNIFDRPDPFYESECYVEEPYILFRNTGKDLDSFRDDFNKLFTDFFYGFSMVDNTGQISSLDYNDGWLNHDDKIHHGKGLFLKNETEHGKTRNSSCWVFRGDWGYGLNLAFAQYSLTKKMTDTDIKRLVNFSSFKIKCLIPLSDVSKYSNFTIIDR